jgi:hypothetical protein
VLGAQVLGTALNRASTAHMLRTVAVKVRGDVHFLEISAHRAGGLGSSKNGKVNIPSLTRHLYACVCCWQVVDLVQAWTAAAATCIAPDNKRHMFNTSTLDNIPVCAVCCWQVVDLVQTLDGERRNIHMQT